MRTILLTGIAAIVASLAVTGASSAGAGTGVGGLPAGWTRAEINVTVGRSPHTLVYNRGEVQEASAVSLTLQEADGSVVVVPLSSSTEVIVNGRSGSITSVRPGSTAVTQQTDGNPAQTVNATVPARPLLPVATGRRHR